MVNLILKIHANPQQLQQRLLALRHAFRNSVGSSVEESSFPFMHHHSKIAQFVRRYLRQLPDSAGKNRKVSQQAHQHLLPQRPSSSGTLQKSHQNLPEPKLQIRHLE